MGEASLNYISRNQEISYCFVSFLLLCFYMFSLCSHCSVSADAQICYLCSMLGPKMDQNRFENRPLKTSKFWLLCGSIFGLFSSHFGGQVEAMLAPKNPQDVSTAAQPAPKMAQVGRRTAQNDSKTTCLPHSADGVPHFWRHGPMGYPILGSILVPSWRYLGALGMGWWGCAKRNQFNWGHNKKYIFLHPGEVH